MTACTVVARTTRIRLIASALTVVTLTAACSSSGTHTQSLSPSAPSKDPTSDSSGVSSSSSPASPTKKPTKPSVPTPSVSPAAQPAVDAYVKLYTLTASLYADPAHANTTALGNYESAKLVSNDVATLKQLATDGRAYRGTLPDLRLKVVLTTPTVVTLTNCGLLSKTDPYEQYDIKTGKPISTPKAAVPPPYLKVLTIQHSGQRWLLQSITTNTARTCTS
jgi:hypothetical protein